MIYLFTGQDSESKDIKLNSLKDEFLAKSAREFNLDVLYARDLKLSQLQERLKCLPFRSPYRMLVIKEARHLKEEIKDFITAYVKEPYPQVVLVLDIDKFEPKNEFLGTVSACAKVCRFQEEQHLDTFVLNRQIESKKAAISLRMLNQLLRKGEKPEKILGGLRYIWQRSAASPQELKKRLKLLLACDIEIKTGRLKPACALEKLVIIMCSR